MGIFDIFKSKKKEEDKSFRKRGEGDTQDGEVMSVARDFLLDQPQEGESRSTTSRLLFGECRKFALLCD